MKNITEEIEKIILNQKINAKARKKVDHGEIMLGYDDDVEISKTIVVPGRYGIQSTGSSQRFGPKIRVVAEGFDGTQYSNAMVYFEYPDSNPNNANGNFDANILNLSLNCRGISNGVIYAGANMSFIDGLTVENPNDFGFVMRQACRMVQINNLEILPSDKSPNRATLFKATYPHTVTGGNINLPRGKVGFDIKGGFGFHLDGIGLEDTICIAKLNQTSDVKLTNCHVEWNGISYEQPLLDLTNHRGAIEVSGYLSGIPGVPFILGANGEKLEVANTIKSFFRNKMQYFNLLGNGRPFRITAEDAFSQPEIRLF